MVTSPASNGGEVKPHHHRNASRSPPPTLSLYQSNLDTMRLAHRSLISPPSFLHKGATLSPPMPYDYDSQVPDLSDKYPRPGSADGIPLAWANTASPTSPFSNSQSTILIPTAGTAPDSGSSGLASVSNPSIGFEYSTPASTFSFPSPVFFSGEISSIQQRHLTSDHLPSCPPVTPSLECHLLPSASSHDSPNHWTNHNLSIHALSSAHLSSSNSSLTHSDPLPSDSSSRSWTPDQTEHNPPIGQAELNNTSHQFPPLGSPANFEKLSQPFFSQQGLTSPPNSRPPRPDSTLRALAPSQRAAIYPSDASSDAHCSPLTPLSMDPPSLRLMSTSANFGISPAWFEPEIFSPLDGAPHSDYEGNGNPHLLLPPRNSPLSGDPLRQPCHLLDAKGHSGLGSPIQAGQPGIQARFMAGKRHGSTKSIPGSSCRVPLEPISKPNEARALGCNKKKKREVREVEASCGTCGKRMARLTLRGSPEELYVADGFDVIHTCKPCQEGRPGRAHTNLRNELGSAPFSERAIVKIEQCQEVDIRPDSIPQGAVTTFRKRNRRTDDVTAPTTCDCCARQLGVGGIVPRNGRSAIQFVVEVVCVHCVSNFRRCTDCGGGGGSRLGVGKWRCKELFSDGRRTCILSHQRQGASTEVITTVWKVRQLTEKPELDTLVGQLRELVKHSLYAALATPEILESGLARVSKFDDIKTMYANGWKQIQPLIHEDVETSTGKRRYVGLRWTKPHPRKGPKRGANNTCDQVSPSVREGELLLEPGKELSGFVLSEWDMHRGTFFVSVAMPWQSGDALESTAGLAHKSLIEAKADREQLVDDLVNRGMNRREANLRYPPIRHLWTILFFHRETRLVQFLEKRRKFMPLEDYLSQYPDAQRDMFPPERDCYVPRDEQLGWNVWVRREHGTPPKTPQ
ncbi:hypothetical protein PGT21_001940 [Puccinia graminis f. sp. tritici]|uniref:Uncharacterized protein n=1 Tax=Puccinia graminis f. sp. tritici TaxID=56615 RepID=A0A5B0MDZ2_PUCGR|nr:hypothetical protein PGTUg99_004901 [Puccinia graminis f. sp. tritici]KAA1074343.1 hypothetical protein PGT21_001940 [Puccinia graminis f. sp. tritici]